MTRFRSRLLARRWRTLALVVAALAVRLAVPAGVMPAFGPGGATLTLCTGHGTVTVPGEKPVRPDLPCAFTGLLAAALDAPAPSGLPPRPLPVAAGVVPPPVASLIPARRLRPPLRGPPEPATA